MAERVSVLEVAKVMDSILDRAGVDIPNRLHRVVAQRTGLHPTTVLRYHRRQLESADARVLECLQELEERVLAGESLFTAEDLASGIPGVEHDGGSVRVSVHELQRRIDCVLSLLEKPGPYILYRYLADHLGMHATTVMRYVSGELPGIPAGVITVLRDLERSLELGEVVVLGRGTGEGGDVVPRRCFIALLDELVELGILASDIRDSDLERMLDARRGTLSRIRSSSSWPFVRLATFKSLVAVRDAAIYDPTRHYEVGDRLYHHDLGSGTVVDKRHKSRILVHFVSGVERLLREDVWLDPRWPHPNT
jgi:hypothetical protein